MHEGDDDEITPAWALIKFWEWLPVWLVAVVVVFLVCCGLAVAGNHFSWWQQEQGSKHTAKIISSSVGAQSGDIQQLTNYNGQLQAQLRQVTDDQVTGQSGLTSSDMSEAYGIAQQMCAITPKLITIPRVFQAWVSANCTSGALSAGATRASLGK